MTDAAGRPLGLLGIDADFRRAEPKDSARWVEGLERARELAAACPETKVAAASDREGDFWELLDRAGAAGAALPVRAGRSAKRQVRLPDGTKEDLWSHMDKAPSLGARKVKVPQRGGPHRRPARIAGTTVRSASVELVPPQKVGGATIRTAAVSAKEETPPRSILRKKKNRPLHWLLPATEGGPDEAAAAAALRQCELRWKIERFFHAPENGTRIKDRRLDEADDPEKCLAFDATAAFRVWDPVLLAREKPDEPARRLVPMEQIRSLCHLARKRGFKVPREPPEMDVRTFVVLVAGQSGFHPSKRQPLPGTKKVWRGYKYILNAVYCESARREWKEEMEN